MLFRSAKQAVQDCEFVNPNKFSETSSTAMRGQVLILVAFPGRDQTGTDTLASLSFSGFALSTWCAVNLVPCELGSPFRSCDGFLRKNSLSACHHDVSSAHYNRRNEPNGGPLKHGPIKLRKREPGAAIGAPALFACC